MNHHFLRYLAPLLAAAALSNSARDVAAGEPLVFISAFAPGEKGAIHAYRLNDETGALALAHQTTDVEHPFFLALSPDQRFLYSIHGKTFGGQEHEQVAAYEVVGRSGKLKLLNRQSARGSAACYLDVDSSGKVVLVANYTTGSVASFPVRANGSLGAAATLVQHAGASVNPDRQQGPHAHCIVVSPDNRFVYAADLGLDQVLGYRLDTAGANITANRQPFVRTLPGAGPRHLTFHPNGRYVYVINELLNSISWFDYDSETGILIERQTMATLPEDFDGTSHCADLKITPDGRFLYGTNRGHDSLAAFSIEADGRLKLLGIEPSLGKGPQNLLITPNGKLLLCANMPANSVAVFRIDAETGGLKSVGEPTVMPMPSCMMLLR